VVLLVKQRPKVFLEYRLRSFEGRQQALRQIGRKAEFSFPGDDFLLRRTMRRPLSTC